MSSLMRKRDGSVVGVIRNPDGSFFETPLTGDLPLQIGTHVETAKLSMVSSATNVSDFLRKIGRRGGQARAARHTRDEIAAWGRVRHKNGVDSPDGLTH